MINARSFVRFGIILFAAVAGCDRAKIMTPPSVGPTVAEAAEAPGEGLRVLFIGNSLTSTHDVPGLVHALAKAAGERPLAYKSVLLGGSSLDDQWDQGESRRAIASAKWDVVVLQQGPSALPESRTMLVASALRFAEEIRKAGARPALYMVWPSFERAGDFDRVRESYRAAAEAVDGLFFPAGEAWRAAWRRDPKLDLYSPDGLHPTPAGAYLAALVIFEQLYHHSPIGLPAKLSLGKSGDDFELPATQAKLLQESAGEANAKYGKP